MDLIYCIDLHRERNIAGAIDGIPDTNLDYMKLVLMIIDAAAAAQNFCIAAESEGLGTVYIGNILNQQEWAARLLKLPEGVIPVIMVCCGWPAAEGTVSKKYPRSIKVHREQYEEKNLEELLTAFREKYQDWKMKPSEKLLRKIGETAERNFGPNFREKNRRAMLDRGEVDPLSFWYGYYYAGINGIMTQREHLAFLERQNMPFFQG